MVASPVLRIGFHLRTVWPLLVLCSAPAAGQDPAALRDLRRLHDELCNSQRVIPLAEGQAALEKLRAWNLSPRRLSQEQRGQLLRTEIYAALAVGEAPRVADKLAELQSLAPDARETLEAAYLVAAATGHTAAGQEALKRLSQLVESRERRMLSQRRRWLRRVGGPAPEVEIKTDGGMTFSTRERHGVVLVIDFWNTRSASPVHAQTLKHLYQSCRAELRVQVIGVNTDSRKKADQARQFAREAGYVWPQLFEQRAAKAPITHQAFQAGAPPWTVVIGGGGRIRAVGAATEPGLHYALRVAVAETARKVASPQTGRQPGANGAKASPARPPSGSPPDQAKRRPTKGELPSNPEAAKLLKQARVFLRTGMKTKAKELLKEIIRKYPGTREAKDAEERLDLLP